ncbi:ankyrin repeat protein [Diplodia corticola]|uniref:Ankyrin repeat protein n=1 Tax=Diplodia corticola TaxID=236234 RepID=A0A1J9RGK8_9PEZI|nr:ankyrin repeat protein [Diplodia corticola]OJD40678.1 ankyrin repeat protein [Diplodia corticola]
MDPATVLSMAGACLTLVTRTVTDVNDIVGKYRKMDQKLSLIAARLGTIKATMSQLESWLRSDGDAASTPEIERDLRDAISACSVVVTEIQLYVTNVRKGWLGGKFRYLWDEGQFLQFSSALDSQIAALGLFVNVILLNSNAQRRVVLDSAASRRALREACDQASLYTNRRKSLSVKAGSSSFGSPTSEGSAFTFDDELIDSETYRATFRRVMTMGTQKEGDSVAGGNRDVREALPSGTSSSGVPSTASAIFDSRNSETLTMTTVSTGSTASTSSTHSYGMPNADWKKTSRNRSWSSRSGKQSRALVKDLCLAAAQGDTPTIESLCSKGADVNGRYEIVSFSPTSIKEDQGIAVKSIFRHASSSSKSERTPLHHAAEHGQADAIRVLIARGADPNAKAKGGRIPLHAATGASETVETLIALGAKILATDDTGATPLHALSSTGQADGVKALLAARCPVDMVDKAQRTPLHHACRRSANTAVVSALLSAGAYANAPDAQGLRPLHEACKNNNAELIPLLASAGADIEAPAKDLWRPLHYAAAYPPPSPSTSTTSSPLLSLLSLSASVTACTATRQHPLHLAVSCTATSSPPHPPSVAALLSAGAPVDATTAAGRRPLHLALQAAPTSATQEVVRMLLEHGADPVAGPEGSGGGSSAVEAPLVVAAAGAVKGVGPAVVVPLVEVVLEFGGAGREGEVAGRALLVVCEGRVGGGGGEGGKRDGRDAGVGGGGALLDVVRLLVGPRGGARPTHEVFRALWRNGKLGGWEKRAVHAVLNEVAPPGLRRDEAEWLIVAL